MSAGRSVERAPSPSGPLGDWQAPPGSPAPPDEARGGAGPAGPSWIRAGLGALGLHGLLAQPALYHYLRQGITGGMPFRRFVTLYGLGDPGERVADLGCGPADILRYLNRDRRPQYYLGIDLSESYLAAARRRAAAAGVDARLLAMDLTRIPSDPMIQRRLIDLLEEERISRVLLLGVLHHIPDEAAAATLDLIHRASGVQTLVTQDIVLIAGHPLNNLWCRMDRGVHVRDEAGYDELARRSAWEGHRKEWTHPGFQFIKYIHYIFQRVHSR
ncbi:MAG TPA: class I SAM-dependent methyltransferase [Isosphaeraceae bacterium]|nr:class I SAM-dependent methyltransferase [Isosphaeraceae bacterium]